MVPMNGRTTKVGRFVRTGETSTARASVAIHAADTMRIVDRARNATARRSTTSATQRRNKSELPTVRAIRLRVWRSGL